MADDAFTIAGILVPTAASRPVFRDPLHLEQGAPRDASVEATRQLEQSERHAQRARTEQLVAVIDAAAFWQKPDERTLRDGVPMFVIAHLTENSGSPPAAMVGVYSSRNRSWRSVPGDRPIYPVRRAEIPPIDEAIHG